jgi:hypothetical protein
MKRAALRIHFAIAAVSADARSEELKCLERLENYKGIHHGKAI